MSVVYFVQSVSYASCKPLSAWIKDLVARVAFLRHWADSFLRAAKRILQPVVRAAVSSVAAAVKDSIDKNRIQASELLTDNFWLPGFSFLQGL